MRYAIRTRHYSPRTEEAYVHWIRRYIVFHGKKHPSTLGAADIAVFLAWLAVERKVSASREESAAILKQLTGTMRLIVMLLYGTGVRIEECVDRRVKDLDFGRHQVIVRQGKGRKD